MHEELIVQRTTVFLDSGSVVSTELNGQHWSHLLPTGIQRWSVTLLPMCGGFQEPTSKEHPGIPLGVRDAAVLRRILRG